MDHEDDIRARIQAAAELRRKAPPTARIRFGGDGRPFLADVGRARRCESQEGAETVEKRGQGYHGEPRIETA